MLPSINSSNCNIYDKSIVYCRHTACADHYKCYKIFKDANDERIKKNMQYKSRMFDTLILRHKT